MGFIIAYSKYIIFVMTRMYRRILDIKGRTKRQEFWWGFLYYLLIAISGEIYTVPENAHIVWRTLDSIFELFIFVTIAALITSIMRRLHDADRSAWAFWVVAIPFIGPFILLAILCLPSGDGSNKFGPQPKPWRSYAL